MALRSAIAAHFEDQAGSCERLGSPFTAALLRAAALGLDPASPLGAAIDGWTGDPKNDALALRLAGALAALARSGSAPDLAAVYPPARPGADALAAALAASFEAHHAALIPALASAPQTNEPRRAGILLGGAFAIAARCPPALDWFEPGASAGVNLFFDRFSYDLGAAGRWGDAEAPVSIPCDWRGAPPRPRAFEIAGRRACDIAPVPAGDPAARARLLSYIWADQTERAARVSAALALAARAGVEVERADAAEWIAERLADAPVPGRTRVVAHTIFAQYMPLETKSRFAAAIAAAGARATAAAPLAHLSLEADEGPTSTTRGAAITLRLWRGAGEERIDLGRGDFHGGWAEWRADNSGGNG